MSWSKIPFFFKILLVTQSLPLTFPKIPKIPLPTNTPNQFYIMRWNIIIRYYVHYNQSNNFLHTNKDKSIRLGLKKKQVKTKQGIKRNTEKRIGNFHAVKGTPGKSWKWCKRHCGHFFRKHAIMRTFWAKYLVLFTREGNRRG